MSKKIIRMTQVAMLAAIIVVLQLLSYVIKIGTFNLSLVLIPIVVGAILYGAKTGAFLGGVFGVVVTICCVTGMDAGGAILWNASPVLTAAICIAKGALAGFCAGAVAHAFKGERTRYVGMALAAMVAPIVNTGLFLVGLATCFYGILVDWAGGTDLLYYIVFGLVGVNFLIEFALNTVLSPVVVRIVNALRKEAPADTVK